MRMSRRNAEGIGNLLFLLIIGILYLIKSISNGDTYALKQTFVFLLNIGLIFSPVIVIFAFRRAKIRTQILNLANNELETTVSDFLKLHGSSFKKRGEFYNAGKMDFPGVYILHNKTKNKYYVGQ